MTKNVIALALDTKHAGNAVRALQNLHPSRDIRLGAVAIVERIQDGRTIVLEHAESSPVVSDHGRAPAGPLPVRPTGRPEWLASE